jgi:hypothetical protein
MEHDGKAIRQYWDTEDVESMYDKHLLAAEMAHISLQEVDMELSVWADDKRAGGQSFGRDVQPFKTGRDVDHDCVVVASFVRRDQIREGLLKNGIPENNIRNIFNKQAGDSLWD